MPFSRLAIAAALTVALVLPSAASAQAPTGLAQPHIDSRAR